MSWVVQDPITVPLMRGQVCQGIPSSPLPLGTSQSVRLFLQASLAWVEATAELAEEALDPGTFTQQSSLQVGAGQWEGFPYSGALSLRSNPDHLHCTYPHFPGELALVQSCPAQMGSCQLADCTGEIL